MMMMKYTFNNNDDEIHSIAGDSIQTPSYYTSIATVQVYVNIE